MAPSTDPSNKYVEEVYQHSRGESHEPSSTIESSTNYGSHTPPAKPARSQLEQDAAALGITPQEYAARRGMPYNPTSQPDLYGRPPGETATPPPPPAPAPAPAKPVRSVLEQDAEMLGIAPEVLAAERGVPYNPTSMKSPQDTEAWSAPSETNADTNKKKRVQPSTSTRNSEKQIQPAKHLRNATALLALAAMVGSCNGVMGYLSSKESIRIKALVAQDAIRSVKEEKQAAAERSQTLKTLPKEVLERQKKYLACSEAGRRSDDGWMKYCLSGKP